MKTLYWDSEDPLDCWDNPNCRWGDPSYRLEPGDPGYVPWPPAPPPPKPRRRPTISLETLNLPQNMQPFRYLIALIQNRFTSRAALRPSMKEAEYLDTLAARSQLTRAQVEKLLTEQSGLHVELARQGIPVDYVLKRYRLLPSCGGRYDGPDPDPQLVRDSLSFSVVIHPDEIDKMRVDCPVEKSGETGEHAPTVTSVRGRPGNLPSRYGVGTAQGTEVNGDYFRASRSDAPWPTAELTDANGGNPVAVTVLDCTPTRLVLGGAPTGTTGPRFMKVTDADGRWGISDEELTPV